MQRERAGPGSWHICAVEQSSVKQRTCVLWYLLGTPLFLHTFHLVAGVCGQTCLKENKSSSTWRMTFPYADPAALCSPCSSARMSPLNALQLIELAEVSVSRWLSVWQPFTPSEQDWDSPSRFKGAVLLGAWSQFPELGFKLEVHMCQMMSSLVPMFQTWRSLGGCTHAKCLWYS